MFLIYGVTMDGINSLTSVIGTLMKGGLFVVLLVILAAAAIWWRTRSGHTVFSRIWTLFASRRSNTSLKTIKQFHEKQATLQHFKFTTGLKVRTALRMERVVEWVEANDEDIGDVARCGSFFDLELPGLGKAAATIKWWHEIFPFTFALLLGAAGIIGGTLMVSDSALLTLTETKKNILLSSAYVKPINEKGFRFAACGKSFPPNTGFTEREQQILCEIAQDPDLPKVLARSLKEQRWALAIFAAIFLFSFTFFWTFYREMTCARLMSVRLAGRLPQKQENKADEAAPSS
jgi:hypothetical protein